MSRADVLIVGAGTSGCVLAARLAQRGDRSVLLLEAGAGYSTREQCPAALRDPTAIPDAPWVVHHPAELTGSIRTTVPRGRVLGGSAAVNGCVYVQPSRADFADWPQGWSFDDVLPYFDAAESVLAPRHDPVLAPISATFADVCADAEPVPLNIDRGERFSTALAYLLPALSLPNLRLMSGTSVDRVVVAGGRAVGVEIAGEVVQAGQIVLCAGAIETAILLLRSGIGDPAAVGVGFTDHPEVVIPYRNMVDSSAFPLLQVAARVGAAELRPYTASFGLGVTLLYARSRGRLRLVSGRPVLEYHYLASAADRSELAEAIDVGTATVSRMAAAGVVDWDGTDFETRIGTSQHLSGTCRLGAVVDERCRVHGVEGLSIADTSIIPVQLGCGPAATAVMIGERFAALLP